MFESFNKQFESIFRTILILWVVVWSIFNLFNFVLRLGSFQNIANDGNKVGSWFFDSIGSFVGFILAIFIVFIVSNIPKRIAQVKKVSSTMLLLTLGCIYFLLPTLTALVGKALFDPFNFIKELPFTIVWLLPSITFLILHVLYIVNLNKYNEQFLIHNQNNGN
jgi:hypothetical protein